MTTPFDTFLKLDRLSTVRRVSLLRTVRDLLARAGVRDLCAQAEDALTADEATLLLEQRWRDRPRAEHAPEAGALAADLVRTLSGLSAALRLVTTIYGEASPRGVQAEQVHRFLFVGGVAALVQQPYAELTADVEVLLARALREHREALVELRVLDYVGRASELNARFARTLFARRKAPPFEAVRAARRAGDLALRQLVAQLLARLTDPQQGEACAQALARVHAQGESLRRERTRRRRRRRDVGEVEAATERTRREPSRAPSPVASAPEWSAEAPAPPPVPGSPRREAEGARRAEAAEAARRSDASADAPRYVLRSGPPLPRGWRLRGGAPPDAG